MLYSKYKYELSQKYLEQIFFLSLYTAWRSLSSIIGRCTLYTPGDFKNRPIVTLSLPHWYPGSGVVLDCINYSSLPSFCLAEIQKSLVYVNAPAPPVARGHSRP